MQSQNTTICRYINLQELYSINPSTYQFTTHPHTNSNKAVTTTKCSYLALYQDSATVFVQFLITYTVDVQYIYCYFFKFLEFYFKQLFLKMFYIKIIVFSMFLSLFSIFYTVCILHSCQKFLIYLDVKFEICLLMILVSICIYFVLLWSDDALRLGPKLVAV